MNKAAWRWHVGAAVLYALLDWGVLDHGAPLAGQILGSGSDPTLVMWFLVWWPWCIAHHVYPLYTHLMWQPGGQNLAWTTSVPLLALLAAPITVAFGPVLSFNLLTLAAPFLAAMAAYWLCLYITRQPAAALLGGYLFGFSAYEMAQSIDHLNLDFCVFVPLAVWLALARLDDRLERKWFVALAVLVLACQFFISAEIFAMGMFFGGIAWGLAYAFWPARRAALLRLVVDGLCAVPFLFLLLSPYLWAMFCLPREINLPDFWPVMFSTNLLNFVLPTIMDRWGAALALPITSHFPDFTDEQNGYLGLPLLVILWCYARGGGRYLTWLLAVILLFSLGPVLWLGAVRTGVVMPWALFRHMVFIGAALPARFMLFGDLVAAVIAALWVAAAPAGAARRRWILAACAAIVLMPAPHGVMDIPESSFFAPGRVEAVLGPRPVVLVLPFGILGPSSYWQAENQFGFVQTGGYLGFPPASVQKDEKLMRFYFGLDTPGGIADFGRYCETTGTGYVVAGPGTPAHVMAEVRSLAWPARQVDDVTIFTVPHG
jgi:hypothetical protein